MATMRSRGVEASELRLNGRFNYIRYTGTFGRPAGFQHVPIENMAIHRLEDPVSVTNSGLSQRV